MVFGLLAFLMLRIDIFNYNHLLLLYLGETAELEVALLQVEPSNQRLSCRLELVLYRVIICYFR